MKKIKKILRVIDAVTTPYPRVDSAEEHNAILLQRSARLAELGEELEVAVRQHVLDLEEAVGCLRSNLHIETTEMLGIGGVTIGFTHRTVVDIRDIERLEEL